MMKKFYLLTTTEGCATNLLENARHRSRYSALGYEQVAEPEHADLILINTCGYNGAMEDRATEIISSYRERFPTKEIVLSGCLPKINPAKIETLFPEVSSVPVPGVADGDETHHFFSSEDFRALSRKHRLVLRLRPAYLRLESALGLVFQPLHNIFRSVVVNEEFFLLTVSQGCVGKCTFCAIKRAKGRLRSRPLETLLAEFDDGLRKGYRGFWLLGDDIGCWGQDLGLSVADLLQGLLARNQQFSVVLNYLDPQFMMEGIDRLEALLSDPRVICANIPLQSGSPAVLQRMQRRYDPAAVYGALGRIKKANRGIALKTNLMVGFPGETWGDFARSLRAVFQFDAVLALRYSPRPHTPAARFGGQIPEGVKALRHFIINLLILLRHAWVAFSAMARPAKAKARPGLAMIE